MAGLSPSSAVNLALRVSMEVGIVAGLAYWGVQTGDATAAKVALGIGAPVVGFGIWGALDFRGAGAHAELLRLVEELTISGVAAGALVAVAQPVFGAVLAAVSVVHHVLVYAIGDRLLEPRPDTSAMRSARVGPTA